MGNPVSVLAVRHEVNTDAVQLIEGLLVRLRSGESVACALVEVGRGGVVSTAFSNSVAGEYHRLNSGAARLANRLAREPDET